MYSKEFFEKQYINSEYQHDHYYNLFRSSIKSNKDLILSIINHGSVVLDFGCSIRGTFHFMGHDPTTDITVYGYDRDNMNAHADFHSLKEIGDNNFDYIVFSQILEHCTLDEISDMLKWAHCHTNTIIISLPNTSNIFTNFYYALSHVRPYDNPDFLYYVEQQGFEINELYKASIFSSPELKLKDYPRQFLRLLFCGLMGVTPYYNFIVKAMTI